MRTRFHVGSTVLLAAILFLNATGLCAALIAAPAAAHHCCPSKTSPAHDAAAPRCCMMSPTGAIPASPTAPARALWIAAPIASYGPSAKTPKAVTLAAHQLPAASRGLFIKLHQFLI